MAKKTDSYDIDTPIISVVEAKKNDMELGVNQCAAQMYGAKLYNEKYGSPLDVIYGCVTTADNWKFLKLEDNLLITGKEVFYMNELETILGIFQHIIDYYKAILEPVEAWQNTISQWKPNNYELHKHIFQTQKKGIVEINLEKD